MKSMLVTGGTVFVSRYAAEYFTARGWDVHVLNRNTRPQSAGVRLIQADRHSLTDELRGYHFDAVVDVTAYTAQDVTTLMNALDSYGDYVLISSSAVYPETQAQPFTEATITGPNCHWGRYGTDKIAAEEALLTRTPNAYIVRPPYLYGPMNNVYREAFAFDCAMAGRKFCLPGKGDMQLHFLHIDDLCRFILRLLEEKPAQHIYNVGNAETVSVRDWAALCYDAAGAVPDFVSIDDQANQRRYFPFHNYEYRLDVTAQCNLMDDLIPLDRGLRDAFAWYKNHRELVNRKPLIAYIDEHYPNL